MCKLFAAIAVLLGPLVATVLGQDAGSPTRLEVQPAKIILDGPRAMQQLLVTGHYAGGQVRDLTGLADFQIEGPAILRLERDGFLQPAADGTTKLLVKAGGKSVSVPITVRNSQAKVPVSFRNEVIAALNVGGCNMGACHGTPSGKNGFKLSLRGYDPDADYLQLTRDVVGRRVSRQDPDASLMLLKPHGLVSHEGGMRFQAHTVPSQRIRAWIEDGLPKDPFEISGVERLTVLPGARILHVPARWQQLAVLAHFSDGTVQDVTRLTNFSSSEPALAQVSGTGLVEFHHPSEVAILCRYLETMQTVNLACLDTPKNFAWLNPPENNFVDRHVHAKLRLLSILPSNLCSDEEFIRRAFLDLGAILPTPGEVRAFLADRDQDKRARLVNRLLDRPEYADFMALHWLDILKASRKTLGAKGVEAYQNWLREQFQKNTPFQVVVRDLLTASGSTLDNPPANYFRATRTPDELAETTAQLFLGIRMQCAKCHNHPFERWSMDSYYSLAAFFARVKQKTEPGRKKDAASPEFISVDSKGDVRHLRTGMYVLPRFPDGKQPTMERDQDRREALADWVIAADNPFFARSVVNRLWFHLFGKGIVDPPDDFRDSNPPANEALLDALAKDFVARKFDVKHTLRTIMNSRTYQLSARSNAFNKDDAKYFSHANPRLLTAEQMMDALCQVTEVPEKYPGMPAGTRAVQAIDPDEMHPFRKAMGSPARELACECERESDPGLGTALMLINGSFLQDRLANPKNRLGRLLAKKAADAEMIDELYLATFSRLPTPTERRRISEYLRGQEDVRKAWEDVLWALFNSREFMYRY